ncbi:MAG: hypothetical protein JW945_07465 [Methanomicrobia archaeon]|nr:hypothetical protein [Methanomicrobia archaeon]
MRQKNRMGSAQFADALIRTLCRIIECSPHVIISDKNQRIGDLAAYTIVVKA